MSDFTNKDLVAMTKLLETAFARIEALEAEAANNRTIRPGRGAILLSQNVKTIAHRLLAAEERMRRIEDELLGETQARDRRKEIYDKARERML